MTKALLEAIKEQERKDFRTLNRLYDRFLDYESQGALAQAAEVYSKIVAIEKDMGLR